jgi:hypothetical protein
VISSVVVSYQVKPEAMAEHVRLIEGVFRQLHDEQPGNIEYTVVRLADGVSFVDMSSVDTPDGSHPLPEMTAFKKFEKDAAARMATPPARAPARDHRLLPSARAARTWTPAIIARSILKDPYKGERVVARRILSAQGQFTTYRLTTSTAKTKRQSYFAGAFVHLFVQTTVPMKLHPRFTCADL